MAGWMHQDNMGVPTVKDLSQVITNHISDKRTENKTSLADLKGQEG